MRMNPDVWLAVVKCKTRKYPFCGPIFLPYPNLPEIPAHPPNWPTGDWKAFVACHVCGGIALFEKQEIEWGKVDLQSETVQRTQNPFHRVFLKCDQYNCDSRIEVLTMWPRGETKEILERRLSVGTQAPTCSYGHNPALPVVVASTQMIGNLE